jgi:hypothetical protein
MKLDLILENIRMKYSLEILEESSLTEEETLLGKIMINESTMQIRKMLVDDGLMESIQIQMRELFEASLLEEIRMPNRDMLNKLDKIEKSPTPLGISSSEDKAIKDTSKSMAMKNDLKNGRYKPERRNEFRVKTQGK